MTEENEPQTNAPEIKKSTADKLTFVKKYKRGCALFDLATPGMVPFAFLLLSQWIGYFGLLLAAVSILVVPILSYETFEYSTRRRIRHWFSEKEQPSSN